MNGGFSSQGYGFGGLQGQLWRMACVSHNAACLQAPPLLEGGLGKQTSIPCLFPIY